MARYKINYKRKSSEVELRKRLNTTIIALITTIGLIYISFRYFGPKIGSLFGLFSKHRKETGLEDKVPPSPPIFSYIPKATNKETIIINGISEPGASVSLFANGPKVETTLADAEGLFTFANVRLIEGSNTIYAKAEDQDKNESEKSETAKIIKDTEKPQVKITSPKNGETIKNLNQRILVQGTLSEKANVHINGRLAIVKPDFNFELLLGVSEGSTEIKVEAQDEAGNLGEDKIFIKYEKVSP